MLMLFSGCQQCSSSHHYGGLVVVFLAHRSTSPSASSTRLLIPSRTLLISPARSIRDRTRLALESVKPHDSTSSFCHMELLPRVSSLFDSASITAISSAESMGVRLVWACMAFSGALLGSLSQVSETPITIPMLVRKSE